MVRELGRHSVKYLIIFAFLTGILYAVLTVNAVKNFLQYIISAIEEGGSPQSTYFTVRGQSYFSRLPKY
jgi:hypothetical protein